MLSKGWSVGDATHEPCRPFKAVDSPGKGGHTLPRRAVLSRSILPLSVDSSL